MTRDEFNEEIILDTLRRFMLNSDLSDRRISRLMGIEIETLRTLVTGTANPRKQSLNKVRSFSNGMDEKTKTGCPITAGASCPIFAIDRVVCASINRPMLRMTMSNVTP
jgi:hypothetical protein